VWAKRQGGKGGKNLKYHATTHLGGRGTWGMREKKGLKLEANAFEDEREKKFFKKRNYWEKGRKNKTNGEKKSDFWNACSARISEGRPERRE